MNSRTVDLLQGAYWRFFLQESKKEVNIGRVGLDGVFGKAFLRDQVVEKKLFCRNKLLGEGCGVDGNVGKQRGKRKRKRPLQECCSGRFRKFLTLLSSPSDAVELAKLTTSLGLFATFFDTGFFIVLTTLQLSFNSINLQFFLQLTDGVFKISTNFNFYHLGLR